MVDIVESIVLQEFSSRLAQRRNNIKANQSLLRNPRKLNNVVSTMGAELLTETQLEDINQKVFRRDPIAALDSSFNESDPRRGSLLKIRNTVRKFISDPNNQHVAPEEIFAKAFKSEEDRANPELTRLFQEKGFFGGQSFDPETDIKFPSSIGLQNAAQTLATNPGGFKDTAIAAVKGAVNTPIDNFALNVGIGAVTAAGATAIAQKAKRGVRGRTAFGRRVQRFALRATGGAVVRKSIGARAAQAVLRGLSFVPHPAISGAARVLSATVAGLSAFEAASGAVDASLDEAAPGFREDYPVASFILSTGAGLAAPIAVRKLALSLIERRSAVSKFTGSPGEVVDIANIGKDVEKGKTNLKDKLADLEFAGKKTLNKEAKKETINTIIDLTVIEGQGRRLLTEATRVARDARQPLGQIGKIKGLGTAGKKGTIKVSPVPFPKSQVGQTKKIFNNLQLDLKETQKLLPAIGKTISTIEGKIGRPITNIIKGQKVQDVDKRLKAVGTIEKPKVITTEAVQSLQKEAVEIRKIGVPKAIEKRKLEVIEVKVGTNNIKSTSAGDLIENSSTVIRERVRVMTDSAIPEAAKVQLNKTYIDMIKQGFSEGAAAKVVVDTAAKLKDQIKTKTASQVFEEEAAKAAKRKPKQKPKKPAEQRFDVDPTDELDKVLAAGASKLGKGVDDLTLSEFESIVKKSGKVLGILGTAIAAGMLLPEDSEASVLSNLGKIIATTAEKAESNALKNASKKLIQNKGESDVGFIERMLKQTRKISENTINSSERRALNTTFNAKRLGLNLDKETTVNNSVNFADKTFGSFFGNLKKMGRVGEVVTNKFIQVDDYAEISTKFMNTSFKESLPVSSITGKLRTNLTRPEMKEAFDILGGITTKGSRRAVETAVKWRGNLDDILTFAEKNGVNITGYRQNYRPQIIRQGVLDTDKGMAILTNSLLKTGQIKNLDEAFEVAQSFRRDRFHNLFNKIPRKTPIKIAGKIELSRRFELPSEIIMGGDGKNVLEALSIYAHEVSLRVARIKAFGPNNEKLEPLLKNLIKNGQDEQFLRNGVNVLLHQKPQSFKAGPTFNKLVGASRAYETLDLLGYAGVVQISQVSIALLKVGPTNLLKGIKNLITSQPTRDMVASSAAVSQTMSKHIIEQFGSVRGFSGKVSEVALKAYGVLGIDHIGRSIAGAAGGEYLFSLAKSLGKIGINSSKQSKLIQRQLRELDLSPAIMLRNIKNGKQAFNDSNLRIAMKRISDITQFRSREGDLPLWFASDHAKLITQFKSFLFQSGTAINNIVIKEAKQGNYKPILTALSVSPFLGAGIQELRTSLKELVGTVAGESPSQIRKKSKFRREQIKKGQFFTDPRDWMGGSSISRVWNDSSYVLALGIMPNLLDDMASGRGVGSSLQGPSISRLSRAVSAVYKDINKGDTKHIEREIGRLTPLGLNQ